jgi:hypothetical protein
MKSSGSSEDLNLIALAKLRELVGADNELLPAWKSEVLHVLGNDVPEDIVPLEDLLRGETNDPAQNA